MNFIKRYFIVIYLTLLAFAIYVLSSCSAEHHLAKAIDKDPSIFKPKVDTIELVTTEYVESIKGKDSLIIDNERVFIKALSFKDSLFLDYKLKAYVFDTIIETEIIDTATVQSLLNRKTRQDKRLDAKQERLETKKNARVKIVTEKQKNKPKENGGFFRRLWIKFRTFLIFIIGLALGVIASRVYTLLGNKLNIFK
jgi:Ca2+/Na+ antiporter